MRNIIFVVSTIILLGGTRSYAESCPEISKEESINAHSHIVERGAISQN